MQLQFMQREFFIKSKHFSFQLAFQNTCFTKLFTDVLKQYLTKRCKLFSCSPQLINAAKCYRAKYLIWGVLKQCRKSHFLKCSNFCGGITMISYDVKLFGFLFISNYRGIIIYTNIPAYRLISSKPGLDFYRNMGKTQEKMVKT